MEQWTSARVGIVDRLLQDGIVPRIWKRDISAWGAQQDGADARSIATRLGWLDVPTTMAQHLDRAARLGRAAREERVEAVYLLGMGGSSLCAEVFRTAHGIAAGQPELFVLDTTDELTITSAAARMDPARNWFVVASKSGGTVEVSSMEKFFWQHMHRALGDDAGRHFIAITDPGTPLQTLASDRGYRETFLNPPDIGGRFSALSLFGLVPAALIGADVHDVLAAGSAMAEGCRQENHANAGLELGAFIGASASDGRDKLTVVLPPSLAALGLWIEQLVAESTGKHGKGVLPVVDEPIGHPGDYAGDRAFVAISTDRDPEDPAPLRALEAEGHPVLRLTTRVDALGAEFFRWEFATAVAGAILRINPFDEPNVSEAKDKTRALLAEYARSGSFPQSRIAAESPSLVVYSNRFAPGTPGDVIREGLASLGQRDYLALLSYLPAGSDVQSAIMDIRTAVRAKARVATTFGIGPRYLHSTGQYHKGGPNTAVAIIITADDATQTPVPEAGFSFSVLKRAQALGDTETLEAHGRRTIRIHVKEDQARAAVVIEKLFAEAMK